MKQTIYTQLEHRFRSAFNSLGFAADTPMGLIEASKPEFGDYQVNGVMTLAKTMKTNPRALAENIIKTVDLNDIANEVSIAGPGFINIKLSEEFLSQYLNLLDRSNKFGVTFLSHKPQKVVVDLSSPNLAKEMHVGHLRSTVIGDALARIFEYLGDSVIRQNHVGDWGTQFGMLIAYMFESNAMIGDSFLVNDLEEFYRAAKLKFDEDKEFANRARQCVALLQGVYQGEDISLTNLSGSTLEINGRLITADEIKKYWEIFRTESLSHCQRVYEKLCLGTELSTNATDGVVCGESFYEADLSEVVSKLEQVKIETGGGEKALVSVSDGAKCIFFEQGDLPGAEETPFIIQKKDGAYLYSTTDLAAIRYRVNKLNADKIVYVVDARQSFHFKQLFKVAEKSRFDRLDGSQKSKQVELTHSAFGTMMNEDGKPFKTRDGGTVKLIDLIEEAEKRALDIVTKRNPDWTRQSQDRLAKTMAISAIKYSDLSKNRTSDYIFSFDKMLAFDGNTAPYLLYANTRICSLIAKASDIHESEIKSSAITIHEMAEHRLGFHLAGFANLLESAAAECYPHYVCQYLYHLSGLFMQFYESCPILKAETNVKLSRLKLSKLTQDILQTGLRLLGIDTVSEM